jgi:hypothetical protein
VVLTQVTTLQGAFPGSTTTTATGCTVVLGSGASLDFSTLTMRFGGPFVVQGGDGARVSLQQATVTAPTVSLQLTGSDGQFLMNESRLAATGGALSLQFGDKGFMEVKNSGGWYQPRLSARGRLNLSAGANFNGNIVQSGIQGARGIVMAFNGAESAMKIENTDMLVSSGAPSGGTYTNGPFQVTGSAAKQSFEIIQSNLMEAGAAVTIALNGSESKLGLSRLTSQTGSQRIAITALGSLSEVKVENVLLYGNPDVIIEAGAQGSVTVANSPGSITATNLIRARAGLGGSCSVSPQGLSAPTVQICR